MGGRRSMRVKMAKGDAGGDMGGCKWVLMDVGWMWVDVLGF